MHVTLAARQAQVQKLVMVSHTWLYGAHPSNPNFLTEKHPLRAPAREPFFRDKIEAEEQARRLTERSPGAVVTVLRMAPLLGPTVQNAFTRYLARRVVPTMMGFDPLVGLIPPRGRARSRRSTSPSFARRAWDVQRGRRRRAAALSTVVKLAGSGRDPDPAPPRRDA